MAVPGRCSVCTLPTADAIDRDLAVSGASVRDVARRYGLGRSAVGRHMKEHLGGRLQRAAAARASGSADDLLDRLLELVKWSKGIFLRAYNTNDLPTALQAIGRLERQLELEARLCGKLRDGSAGTTVVNVTLTPDEAFAVAELAVRRRPKAIDTTTADAAVPKEGE